MSENRLFLSGEENKYSSAVAIASIVKKYLEHSFLWAPAQRTRATMLYFANFFIYLFIYFFMAALFSGPGERRFAKVLHVVDLECH